MSRRTEWYLKSGHGMTLNCKGICHEFVKTAETSEIIQLIFLDARSRAVTYCEGDHFPGRATREELYELGFAGVKPDRETGG